MAPDMAKGSSQEIKLAQKLAGNEKKYRDRALKKLKKWIEARSQSKSNQFTDEEMIRIWKGLHYCMWMQDKALLQEELASNLSGLIRSFQDVDQAFLFVESFVKTECREWYGIDRLRLDKFMMLFRMFLRESFQLLKSHGWTDDLIDRHKSILTDNLLILHADIAPVGLQLHLIDIFWYELTKTAAVDLNSEQIMKYLDPFCQLLSQTRHKGLIKRLVNSIFIAIIQESDVGLEEESDSEDEKDEETDEMQKPAKLKVDYKEIADRLFLYGSSNTCVGKNRTQIYDLVKKFRDLSEGIFPVEELSDVSDTDLSQQTINNAVKRLQNLDDKLLFANANMKKRKNTESLANDQPKKKKAKKEKVVEESVSSDEEVVEAETKKSKKAKKKKKKEKGEQEQKVEENDADNESEEKEDFVPSKKSKKNAKKLNETTDADMEINHVVETPKTKKKKGAKNASPEPTTPLVVNCSPPDSSKENDVNASNKKKGKKSRGTPKVEPTASSSTSSDQLLDGEIEISIMPSRKKKKKGESPSQDFIKFEKATTPIPAFVKGAILKATPKRTPKTKGTKNEVDTPASGKKKVVFDISRNKAQDFKESLVASPVVPFDPENKPEQGILKSPGSVNGTPVLSRMIKLTRPSTPHPAKNITPKTKRKSIGSPAVIAVPGKKGKKSPKH